MGGCHRNSADAELFWYHRSRKGTRNLPADIVISWRRKNGRDCKTRPTRERKFKGERRNDSARRAPGTMTTREKQNRRNDAGRRPASTITTLCACGARFVRVRAKQRHCSRECRQKAYESSDRARSRRAKYWSSAKGKQTLQRYRHTGGPARNSQSYRRQLWLYHENFYALLKKRGYEKLSFDVVFGDKPDQIPVKAAYRMFDYWGHNHRCWFGFDSAWRPPWKLKPNHRLFTEMLVHCFYDTIENYMAAPLNPHHPQNGMLL